MLDAERLRDWKLDYVVTEWEEPDECLGEVPVAAPVLEEEGEKLNGSGEEILNTT